MEQIALMQYLQRQKQTKRIVAVTKDASRRIYSVKI